jgi:hypothetical protein
MPQSRPRSVRNKTKTNISVFIQQGEKKPASSIEICELSLAPGDAPTNSLFLFAPSSPTTIHAILAGRKAMVTIALCPFHKGDGNLRPRAGKVPATSAP